MKINELSNHNGSKRSIAEDKQAVGSSFKLSSAAVPLALPEELFARSNFNP